MGMLARPFQVALLLLGLSSLCLGATGDPKKDCPFPQLLEGQTAEGGSGSARLDQFMEQYYRSLANDYRTPDGKYRESCALLAYDAAQILLREGRHPHVVSIRGKKIKSDFIDANETLEPLRYQGRVGWGGHTVMIENGIVYDPMVGRPVPFKEYPMVAFGVPEVEIVYDVGPEEIRSRLKQTDQ